MRRVYGNEGIVDGCVSGLVLIDFEKEIADCLVLRVLVSTPSSLENVDLSYLAETCFRNFIVIQKCWDKFSCIQIDLPHHNLDKVHWNSCH